MERFKRIISIMLSVVLMLCIFNQNIEPVEAAELPQVYADMITAEAGKIVTVPIKIQNNTGMVGFCLIVEYDQEVFTPIAVSSGELTQSGILDDSIATSEDNTFKILWSNTADVVEDGILVNVDFAVSEYARGNQSIEMSYSQPDTFNESWEDVFLECTPVQVNVEKPQINEAYLYSEDNLIVDGGETIDIPIVLGNNTELTEGSFDIEYDNSVFVLEDIVKSDAVNIVYEAVESGDHFEVSGLDPSLENQTLFILQFKVEEYISGNYQFDFISDVMDSINFAVQVSNSHGSEGPYVYGGNLDFSSNQITVPILIRNNTGLIGFKMKVHYNSKQIQPVSVTGGSALSGSFADNIGLYDDYFSILWTGTEDVIGNTTLFTITFDVVEGVEAIEDVLVLEYSQEDTFNESWEDVSLNMESIAINWTKPEVVLENLIVSKTTTSYYCGDVISLDDLVVNAVYSDGRKAEVSGYKTNVADIDMSVAGEKQLIVTYEEEGIKKQIELTIQVLPVVVTGVAINPEELELVIGAEANLQATILPENATNQEVLWSSSRRSVVSVDTNGKIKANAVGEATVTVTTEDGEFKDSCKVTVKPILVTSVKLDSNKLSVTAGDKKKLTATVLPANATDKTITWSSSNTKVATVDANGNVTAVAAGTANIIAKANDGSGVEVQCSITVTKKQEPPAENPPVENSPIEQPTTEETLPTVGTKVTISVGQYKITKSSSKTKEVTFVKPKSNKKTSVSIPATVKIDGYTYKVTEIAAKAFKNNKYVKSVTIGNNVKKIGNEAFSGCKNLKKVTIGNKVTTIGKNAFYNCKKLKTITIKSSVLKSVGNNAIKNIDKKATIKVPKKQLSKYKKLFKSKTGYKKTMKIKK